MSALLMLLGAVCVIASLVCYVIILIDAFKNEVWKGILSFFCGLYMLYYAITEFESDKKWLIIAGSLLGGALGGVFFAMSGAMAAAH